MINKTATPKYLVSILVLVDVGLKLDLLDSKEIEELVSILVLVDVGLKPYFWISSIGKLHVSILVLVDVGLKPLFFPFSLTPTCCCFNPCFGGCWS